MSELEKYPTLEHQLVIRWKTVTNRVASLLMLQFLAGATSTTIDTVDGYYDLAEELSLLKAVLEDKFHG